ncbi:hypothetical protein [Sinimarinibacterium thermocellulolyticum]|uniref:DUF4124 domain-containing protein n=1 Tax=Sinimarinibacterium thermocellulolyticum TaxID=3170016 RepID=A0ABV2ABZ4_9GAMM
MFRKSLRRLGLAVLIGGMPMLSAQAAGSIVCWTDENGRRACGDRVPPQYASQERKVYDASGRLIETLPRQKTPEEIEAEQRRAAMLEERRRRAEEQAAYDRYLLTTFTDLEELQRSRRAQLEQLDSRLERARVTLRENRRGVEQLKAQIADFEAAGRKVPVRLTNELATFEKAVIDSAAAVESLRAEREAAQQKFEQDVERYRILKGLETPAADASGESADTGSTPE